MLRIEKDYSLLPYNTFGLPARAACFVEFTTADDAAAFLREKGYPLPLLAVGEGSNLLFTRDFAGTVLHSRIQGFTVVGEGGSWVDVRAGSGVKWDDFVAYTVAHGWQGAENLSLIPGTVGAAAVQNIGAYGVEAKDLIREVRALQVEDGRMATFTTAECRYAYRDSIFKQELKGKYVVTDVLFRLNKQPRFHLDYGNVRAELEREGVDVTAANVRQCIIRIRREKLPDPAVTGNAGSFFMNPIVPQGRFESLQREYPDMPHYDAGEGQVKIPAGWMIDRCGWKGKAWGNAGVHDKQALVLVNRGGATAQEVMSLAEAIIRSVQEAFGVTLRPEVNFI